MVKQAFWKTLLSVGTLAGLFMIVGSANATVKVGDVIAVQNAAQVKDLVSPGVFYSVVHGMRMEVVPTERVEL